MHERFRNAVDCFYIASCDSEWTTVAFYSMFFNTHQSGVLTNCLLITWLVPYETAAITAHTLCAPYNHAQVYIVTSSEATQVRSMRVCQSEWDLLYAAAVTQGGADTKIETTRENISFRVEKKNLDEPVYKNASP